MKTASVTAAFAACASIAAAVPTAYDDGQYRPHPNDWKAQWGPWKNHKAGDAQPSPPPTYDQLEHDDEGDKGGDCEEKEEMKSTFEFTSVYYVTAVPEVVIATDQTSAPGQSGAIGYYNFGIHRDLDTICYNITLIGIEGDYQSPARTATHIHQAVRGRAGPPRIAFPNPVTDADDANIRRSIGCLTGPFVTGVVNNGTDTGSGFTVAQIEDSPANFFADVHTTLFVPGAIRGQLA